MNKRTKECQTGKKQILAKKRDVMVQGVTIAEALDRLLQSVDIRVPKK